MKLHDQLPSFAYRLFYSYTALLNRLMPTLKVADMIIRVFPEMYKPIVELSALSDGCRAGACVLDVGTGTGIVGISAALQGCAVDGVDISPKAIENARFNARQNGVADRTRFAVSDMFSHVSRTYDYILSHPPYVEINMRSRSTEDLWATSDTFVDRLLTEAGRYLKRDGRMIIVWPGYKLEKINAILPKTELRLVSRAKLKGRQLKLALLRLVYLHVGFDPHVYVFEKR